MIEIIKKYNFWDNTPIKFGFLRKHYVNSLSKYLENAVFLHLKRRGYSVYTGKIKGREIDFIAEKDRIKKYDKQRIRILIINYSILELKSRLSRLAGNANSK